MSVSKPDRSNQILNAVKPRMWTIEIILLCVLIMFLSMAFFFAFLYLGDVEFNITRDSRWLDYYIFVVIIFIFSGIIGTILSWIIIKYLFGKFLHRQIKSIGALFKGKRRMKKLWVYLFTIGIQATFFIVSTDVIIADKIPLSDSLALVSAWVILWVGARILSRVIYFGLNVL